MSSRRALIVNHAPTPIAVEHDIPPAEAAGIWPFKRRRAVTVIAPKSEASFDQRVFPLKVLAEVPNA